MSRLTWMQQNIVTNFSKDPYHASFLLEAITNRNLGDFRYALEVMKCDPNLLDASTGLSVFQTVLQTRGDNSPEFIKLCINYGANFYKRSASNRYPIHFAVKSLCPSNLKMFLKNYDPSKMNLKYGGQNSLHLTISALTNSNYQDACECIKILIEHGCSMNLPNNALKTPFYLLLKKQPDINDDDNLVEYILNNCDIQFYTYRSAEIIRMMEKQNPLFLLPPKPIRRINFEFMMELLNNRNDLEFENYFKAFKEEISSEFKDGCLRFLEVAVANGMRDTVEYLLEQGVDVNQRSKFAKYSKPCAFIACSNGYFRILELLLKKPELNFSFNTENQKFTLLHEVCSNFAIKAKENKNVNYQKCFDLIIKDSRCEINAEDDIGCSPLHYTVKYRNDQATVALLKKGAYINEESIFGKTPIDEISRDTLEAFLDECITTKDKKVNEIHIDYNFLIAPNRNRQVDSSDKDGFCREISPLKRITENEELRSLVAHPVLSSFLYLKWSKLSFLFYTNLALFSFFMLTFIYFIVLCQTISPDDRKDSLLFKTFRYLSLVQLWILMLREIAQCILSYKHYFRSLINWFEIFLIALSWAVFYHPKLFKKHDLRIMRAVLILCAAFEFLQIVGNLPILSISTHMVMLKRVTLTFLKSIALYSIILLSFGFAFYMLFGDDTDGRMRNDAFNSTLELMSPNISADAVEELDSDFKNFKDPFISVIRVFVMLTGEFDATDLDLNSSAYCIIFTLFVFLCTIVLFNLLNALAVSDTAAIREKGELIDLIQRINVLEAYERIIFNEQSINSRWFGPKLRAFISLFPTTIPHGKIIVRASKNNEILTFKPNNSSRDLDTSEVELQSRFSFRKINFNEELLSKLQKYSTMSTDIMKKIRQILTAREERRNKFSMEKKMREDIENIKSQMDLQLRLINEIMSKLGNEI